MVQQGFNVIKLRLLIPAGGDTSQGVAVVGVLTERKKFS
jgi:hypothetical protein